MKTEFSNMTGRLEREKQDLQGRYQRALDESNNNKRLAEDLRAQFQRLQQEWHGTKGESTEHKRRLTEQDQKIHALKQQASSPHEITAVKAKADIANHEVSKLRKELESKGVFAPPKKEEDSTAPPVGTIELGEDVFSARLLLRIGYIRQRLLDARNEDSEGEGDMERQARPGSIREFRRSEGSGDEDAEVRSVSSDLAVFDEVAGLFEPEIEEGARGYASITVGWLCICLLTLVVEVAVLVVLLMAGMPPACLEPELAYPSMYWWLLHGSKFTAMFAAGVLLGKDLMDALNYWMVSELLEPKRSCEVTLTAMMRLVVNILVVVVQAHMYKDIADPGTVWLSMSALSFIGGLNGQVLSIAKSGAFGHHIAKTMTSMNYQLTFLSQYPDWFFYARGMVIFISSVFVVLSSAYTFVIPEQICES